MRSALICVFFALVVQKDGSHAENEEYFKPTPIPLIDWPREGQEAAGTLHEIIKTEAPPAVAAVPAHYWEDALRHSVYLTLVRDKIDQLIANGDVISPDRRPENLSQEVDDHDLWEKIKTAKFDRLKEEPIPPSDITILAKGRLLEDTDGYRFAEDNTTQSTCSQNCTKGVKALWSVKRVRQGENSSGKYHYELTFSVTSQNQSKNNKVLKKPYENPVRTFTIKENTPTERPQTRHYEQPLRLERPQRAIWVHKNINPSQNYNKRPSYVRGLDRIFSSLFSDEDSAEEPSYRYKQKAYTPYMFPHHAKAAYVDDREPYHKKLMPYPIPKPQGFRYNHPPIPPPPPYIQHPYLNVDNSGNHPYVPQHTDSRFVPSNVVKTTRPAVLPTPITNHPLLKESSVEAPVKTSKPNTTEHTAIEPEVSYKIYSHPKQPPMKGFFPDHIRPPVYNAPPGVFVTMDKKPFKPMPPLKYTHNNKHKTLPSDFRPSQQILDTQLNNADPETDTAFRPITLNYTDLPSDVGKKGNKNSRKPGTSKKPPKKGEFIKSYRPIIITTTSPEIITAVRDNVNEDTMDWANVLGAFTKTTPMASHRERGTTESVEVIPTTVSTTTISEDNSYEETDEFSDEFSDIIFRPTTTSSTTTTTTTTTPKPTKRTRPPPKFTKQDKIKKHKRVTSTSTTSTTTTTTVKPTSTRKYKQKKQTDDLTPQASSAATSGANSVWEPKTPKAPISTTSSTTTRPTTTTSTTTTSSTIVDTEQPVVTTQPKSKNRFRQSTLMQKGTSVNHDKWSTATLDKNRTNSGSKLPLRRKASKFQGYLPVSTPRGLEVERDREDHKDHAFNEITQRLSMSTTEKTVTVPIKPQATTPTDEEEEIETTSSESHHQRVAEDEDEDEVEDSDGKDTDSYDPPSKDDAEYIFPTTSNANATTHVTSSDYHSIEPTTVATIVASPHPAAKNKTKCKKKFNNLTTTESAQQYSSELLTEPVTVSSSTPSTTTPTTTTQTVRDMFSDLFGGFTMDDITEKPNTGTTPIEPKGSQSEKHEEYTHVDSDLEEFLHSLDKKNHNHVDNHTHKHHSSEEYDDDDESPFNNDNENMNIKSISDDYYDEGPESQESRDQPFSILELMAMQ
ncbi:unnamed protein product [Chrysodeixis includens]|uniref:Uncharacterized protein n=1 Tax=Chrysodeixis includens TaxID=689277 RepID=A0A9P0BPQ5_CHRIL|nr:unnamed protein product [Chrysodeixis includens]